MEKKDHITNNPPAKAPRGPIIKFVTVLVVSVALAVWISFAPLWPATVFIKWQLSWFDGSWYPKYTFAVVWIIMMIVLAFVTLTVSWIWTKVTGKKKLENRR